MDLGSETYTGFLKGKVDTTEGKNMIMQVESVDSNAKVVQLKAVVEKHSLWNLEKKHPVLTPCVGQLVKCKVLKQLNNGVLVKFGKGLGFINHINLQEKNRGIELFNARVITVDYSAKMIHLSNLEHVLEMDSQLDRTAMKGRVIDSCRRERIENNNYIISVQVNGKKQVVVIKKKQMDQDTEDSFKLTDKNHPIDKKVKLTDYNFMEDSFMGMCRQADMGSREKVGDYQAGENIACRVKKIFKNDRNQTKVILELEETTLTGLLEENQYNDKGKPKCLLKEKQKVKMQVVSVETEKNRLFLTMRNQFMSQKKDEMLRDIKDCQEGQAYLGFIQKIDAQRGIIVRFYNQVNGMVSLKDLTAHGHTVETYKLFQTLRVWVTKKDEASHKIQLTLSQASAEKSLKATAKYTMASHPLQGTVFRQGLYSQAL